MKSLLLMLIIKSINQMFRKQPSGCLWFIFLSGNESGILDLYRILLIKLSHSCLFKMYRIILNIRQCPKFDSFILILYFPVFTIPFISRHLKMINVNKNGTYHTEKSSMAGLTSRNFWCWEIVRNQISRKLDTRNSQGNNYFHTCIQIFFSPLSVLCYTSLVLFSAPISCKNIFAVQIFARTLTWHLWSELPQLKYVFSLMITQLTYQLQFYIKTPICKFLQSNKLWDLVAEVFHKISVRWMAVLFQGLWEDYQHNTINLIQVLDRGNIFIMMIWDSTQQKKSLIIW